MKCPRCGGRLTRYRLGDRETVGCGECAYVGVSVDHTARHGPPESWDDALDRFQAEGQTVTTVTREDLPADVPAAETSPDELVGGSVPDEADLVLPLFEAAVDDEAVIANGDTPPEDGEPESPDAGD